MEKPVTTRGLNSKSLLKRNNIILPKEDIVKESKPPIKEKVVTTEVVIPAQMKKEVAAKAIPIAIKEETSIVEFSQQDLKNRQQVLDKADNIDALSIRELVFCIAISGKYTNEEEFNEIHKQVTNRYEKIKKK
jgi:hypothetical protein